MIGVILAAGDGKRLKASVKENYCKPLIKIKEKRLIEYALDNLVELDIDDVYIVVGKEGNLIRNIYCDKYKNLKIHYVVQHEQRGLVDAFIQAVKLIGCDDTVIMQLSDEVFIDLKIQRIKTCINSGDYDFYCGITYEDDAEKIKNNFSVKTDNNGNIIQCIEKPEDVINNIKGTGFCIFTPTALALLMNKNVIDAELSYELCDYINFVVANNKKCLALHIADKEFNVNTFDDLFDVQNYFEGIS